jgi:hypothetical protein
MILEDDHIIPSFGNGLANLAAACRHCNSAKQKHTHYIDFETSDYSVSLFDPRRDTWLEHFEDAGASHWPKPKTPIGRATANLLWKTSRSRSRWTLVPWSYSCFLPKEYQLLFDQLNREERVHDLRGFDVTRTVIEDHIASDRDDASERVKPYLALIEGNRYKNSSRISDLEMGRKAFEFLISSNTDNVRLVADAHNGLSNLFTQAATHHELMGLDPTHQLTSALFHQDRYVTLLTKAGLTSVDELYVSALKYRESSIVARIRSYASQYAAEPQFDNDSYASPDASRWAADLCVQTSSGPKTALEGILAYLDRQVQGDGIYFHANMTASAYLERRRLFLLYFLDRMPEKRLLSIVSFYGAAGMYNEFRELMLAFLRRRQLLGNRDVECLLESVSMFERAAKRHSGPGDKKTLHSIRATLKYGAK